MSATAIPADRLQEHLFFTLFPPEAVRILAPAATVMACKADTTIFREGDDSDSLYLVLDGSVRSASAVAAVDSTLARIPREPLVRALAAMPGAHGIELLHYILNGIRANNERYVQEMVRRMRMSVLGESLNTIIHDFRNPLAVISMAAGLLKQQHRTPEVAENCEIIEEQVTRMNSMAEDVLDFSRGVVRLDCAPTNASTVLERFDLHNHAYLERAGITFQVEPADAWFMADMQKLLRVLQNLVNNAAEMLQEGTGKIGVRVTTEGGTVVLSVSDNGPGIPEEVRTRLFEPFATAGKTRGIGLGLAIVKAIVTSHQGVIQVETAAGKGTTFHLRFPRCQPDGTPWTGAA